MTRPAYDYRTHVPADAGDARTAVLLAIAAAIGFSAMFALLKAAGDRFPPLEKVFFRSVFGLLVMSPILWRAGATALRTSRPFGHLLRSVVGMGSMLCFFWAVTEIPLARLMAVSFTMPLFLTILSVPLLKETVGWRRATATVVGFAGVLIILDPAAPGVDHFLVATLVALAGAVLYALAVIAVRQLSRSESSLAIFFWYTSAGAVVGGLAMPFLWVRPSAEEAMLLVGSGLVGGLAQYAMVDAYRRAPATIVAPFEYTQMLWATLIGYSIFGEVPQSAVFIGGALVIASGLTIWWRETRLAREGRK